MNLKPHDFLFLIRPNCGKVRFQNFADRQLDTLSQEVGHNLGFPILHKRVQRYWASIGQRLPYSFNQAHELATWLLTPILSRKSAVIISLHLTDNKPPNFLSTGTRMFSKESQITNGHHSQNRRKSLCALILLERISLCSYHLLFKRSLCPRCLLGRCTRLYPDRKSWHFPSVAEHSVKGLSDFISVAVGWRSSRG